MASPSMAGSSNTLLPGWVSCSPFYGTDLVVSQCLEAVERLPRAGPRGAAVGRPVPYETNSDTRRGSPFNLPVSVNVGKSQC